MIDLYHNSGKEFFAEVVALLVRHYPQKEHTLCYKDMSNAWKVLASTLQNQDERHFLRNIVKKECNDFVRGIFLFTEMRKGIYEHIAIPLVAKTKGVIGIWIIEKTTKGKNGSQQELIELANFMVILLELFLHERLCRYNKYMDVETGLQGKTYFEQMVIKLLESQYDIKYCLLRMHGYREYVCKKGGDRTKNEMSQLIDTIKDENMGNIYSISEDTVAIVSLESTQEICAGAEYMMQKLGIRGGKLKIIVIHSECLKLSKDIFAEIEIAFSKCEIGSIWTQRPKKGYLEIKQSQAAVITLEGEEDVRKIENNFLNEVLGEEIEYENV